MSGAAYRRHKLNRPKADALFPRLTHQHINVLALASPLASVASLPASSAPTGLQGLPAAARVDPQELGRDEGMVTLF